MKKQLALALTAGVAATGAVVASAATLGGVSAKNLGADSSVIASCDTDGINVDYTTGYDTTGTGQYDVSAIKLSGVNAACNGQTISITLAGDENPGETMTSLWNSTPAKLTVGTDGTATVAVTGTTVPAKKVEHIAVVISGSTTA